EELIEEGYVREIVSKIQTMRKEAGYEVQDHILLNVSGSDIIMKVVEKNSDTICSEILADSLFDGEGTDVYKKDWNINGEEAIFSIVRI
ncbi:MAG TPA: DUF5915 domain-containing protein, partial [Clostridia bacterium]|nr:DUF5915 domain-containing protein [Clostridia bacterium]